METGWGRQVYKSGSFVSRRTKVLGYKREPSRKPASNGHFGFSSFSPRSEFIPAPQLAWPYFEVFPVVVYSLQADALGWYEAVIPLWVGLLPLKPESVLLPSRPALSLP